jgi:cellulose synthase/poly-beta-1,6-N-acetylglucosamine synthase-like glycosyltransferase
LYRSTAYQNRSECYEEVPEIWPVRIRQISRWTMGHNQSLWRYFSKCFLSSNISVHEKIDGLLLLGVYAISPLILMGWIIAITLFYAGDNNLFAGSIALLSVTAFSCVGNFAAFFEISSAVYLDRNKNRMRLLPFNLFNFLIGMLTVSKATIRQVFTFGNNNRPWHKTSRFRNKAFQRDLL